MTTAWHLIGYGALLLALLVNAVLLYGWVIRPAWHWHTRPWLARKGRAFRRWLRLTLALLAAKWLAKAGDLGGLLMIVIVLVLTWIGLIIGG